MLMTQYNDDVHMTQEYNARVRCQNERNKIVYKCNADTKQIKIENN